MKKLIINLMFIVLVVIGLVYAVKGSLSLKESLKMKWEASKQAEAAEEAAAVLTKSTKKKTADDDLADIDALLEELDSGKKISSKIASKPEIKSTGNSKPTEEELVSDAEIDALLADI